MASAFHRVLHNLLASKRMPYWLCALSFLDNTILFVAIEPLFIPILAARRKQGYLLASMLLIGSLAGALTMYALGQWAYEPAIRPALLSLGLLDAFTRIQGDLSINGLVALFLIGVVPIPFQLATLAAGVLHMPLIPFLIVTALSRGIRYFGLVTLIILIGKRTETLLQRYETEIMAAGIGIFLLFVLTSAFLHFLG